MKIGVYRTLMESPADTSGLQTLINNGDIDPRYLVCAIGKTEGNGGANDFTRGYATQCFQDILLNVRPGYLPPVIFGWSGGCEGVLSPHVTFFTQEPDDAVFDGRGRPSDGSMRGEKRLSLSVQVTRDLLPEEVGRKAQVYLVAEAVRRAMDEAQVHGPDDVHLVFVKGPLLTSGAIQDAWQRNAKTVTMDPNASKAYARGAMALGVAVGLEEIGPASVEDEDITHSQSLYSRVALTSAGAELTACEVILFANSVRATSGFRIGHGLLRDVVDLEGVVSTMRTSGLLVDGGVPRHEQTERIVAVFAKAAVAPDGRVRGFRTTMLSDADIHYERHARAALGGMLTAVVNNPALFISGGTEHHGEPGEAPIAMIVRV